ncbi:MAG: hypothetical protein ACYSWU_17740, partial [Planctomycetota bacterium]
MNRYPDLPNDAIIIVNEICNKHACYQHVPVTMIGAGDIPGWGPPSMCKRKAVVAARAAAVHEIKQRVVQRHWKTGD